MYYLVIVHLFLSCFSNSNASKVSAASGLPFVVSLAVKVLVAYMLLPHYILGMEAADCAHWIRRVLLEARKVNRSKYVQ